ncbi:MAG TPA: hypothetical protein VGD37_42035 [Kofleriaceae bacterium]
MAGLDVGSAVDHTEAARSNPRIDAESTIERLTEQWIPALDHPALVVFLIHGRALEALWQGFSPPTSHDYANSL